MSLASFNAAPAEPDVVTPPTRGERERVCRVRNALVALDRMCIAVSPTTVTQVYEASVAAGLAAKDMLLPHVLPSICQTAMATSGMHARPTMGEAAAEGVGKASSWHTPHVPSASE